MRWVYLFFLILLALSTWIHTVDAVDVDVPDEVLAKRLRSVFGLGAGDAITDSDLENLIVLSTTQPGETDPKIADLTGLEFAINLETLTLVGHNISDLQPLTTWDSINWLELGGNSIVDLGPLENLNTLTILNLSNNQIVDVSPLAGLTNLTTLTLVGNDGLVDTSPLAWFPPTTRVDVDIPLAVRINDVPTSKQSGAFNVTIEFSEVVRGFEAGDIDLTGEVPARVDSLTPEDPQNPLKYTATIIPASGAVGEVIIRVPADVAVDEAGNGNTASDEYTVSVDVVDLTRPSVNITDVPTTANAPFEVTITFSEDVMGFAAGDISLTGSATAEVSELTGSGSDYTATITPTTSGSVIIQVLADAVEDAATNLNTASESHTVFVSVDLVRPSVVISDVPATANAPFEVTITFSEDVTGFMADDIELTGTGSARVDSLTQDPQDSLKYTATITPTISGFVYIQVLADAVEDNATNLNTASERHIVSVSVDLVRPSVVISDVPTTSQNSDFDITIMFSESVTGFRASDISLTGTATAAATVSVFSGSGSGITYTASITPTGSGDLTIQVPANVAQGDVNNNKNTASRAHTVSVDLVRPSVSITGVPPTSQNSDFDITIMFSESVTGFQASGILLTGTATAAATVSAFSGSGTTYTASITPTGSGDLTIRVRANVAQDDVSNNNTASRAHTVSVDLVRPSVVISDVPTTSQNSDFDITITFSESVTGFQSSDISLTGTATARVVLAGSGTTYTASITPIGSGDLTIRVPANVAQDDVSNNNTASRAHTVSVDLVRPSVSITGVPTIPQNGAFDVTITFSESVTGFVAGDISLGGSAAATATLSGSGSSYTARIMPSAGANGSVTISVAANIAEDAAMNGNTASSGTETVEVDLTRPSVNITGVPTTSQNSDFDITITFSESVTGFQASDISLTGTATAAATVSAFSGSGTTYTASITPIGSGDLTIRVPANVAQDDVSNNNTASRAHTVSVDLVRPSVSITDVPTIPQNGAFDVTITFDESVTGFVAGDIDLTGTASATVDSLTPDPQDPLKYTATITPTTSGSVIIQVLADAVEDAATNLNTASESHTVSVDLVRPSVVISDVPTTSQNSDFDITITFSESVTGFQASDISLTGTATARVVLAGSGTTYTATITPIGSGDLTIRVPAKVAQDDVSNKNTASGEHTVSVDLVRPSVSITGVPTTPQNGAFDVTITFDESVTGFVAGDIDLTGTASATVDSLIQEQNPLEYTARITPASGAVGDVIIQVLADAVEDAAGNGNAESDLYTVEVDVDRPTVTITSLPGVKNGTFEVDFTFNEVVTGFVLSDISLGGPARAIVFSLTPEDPQDPLKYTATIRPTTSGSVIIRVLADAVEDTAGNGNAESDRYTVEVDVDRPTVTIASPSGPYNDTFEVDFTFNEVVTGFVLSDISLGDPARATVDSLTQEDPQDPLKYTATITPTTSGSVIIQVPADAVEDTAGNGNAESDPYTVKVDVDRPTVTITSPSGPYNAPFDVTISFSEDVTGFGTSAIIVTGEATATAFSGSGADYRVTITPNADKESDVTLQVRANVAQDLASNNNTASTVTSPVHIDTIVPTVAISGLPTGEQKGVFDVTITFSEDVTGFGTSAIIVTGEATATAFSGSGADYEVTITPSANAEGNVRLQVKENAVMDLAGNNNIASPVTSPVHIDTIVPTVAISGLPPGEQKGVFDVTITFSEAVTGFGTSAIIVTGEATATVFSGSGADYRVTITPNADKESDVTLQVRANVAQDLASNNNTASTVTSPVHIDTIVPTVAISGLPPGEQKGVFDVTITFSEAVTGFGTSAIIVTGEATATAFSGSGADYEVTITPSANAEGNVRLQVKENAVIDLAGNNNIASPVTSPVHIDTIVPTVAISGLPPGEQKGPFDVTITFSESVTGFVVDDDIELDGPARIALKPGSDDDATYTVTITPHPDAEGDVTLQVKANAVMDLTGNNNTASTVTSPVHIDTIVPTVAISGLPTGEQKGPFDVTITFSEDVTGFGTSAIIVTGEATATAFSGSDGDATYTVTITPNANEEGDVTLQVKEDAVMDLAGNNNIASPVTSPVHIDTIVPTVKSIAGPPPGEKNVAFEVTITFSEDVKDFQASDLGDLVYAAASLKSGIDGDATYVVTITPGVNKEGNVTLQVPSSVVTDLAGNHNTASTVTSPVHIDTIVPTVESIAAPNGTQNGEFDAIITFSEDVTGFDVNDISPLSGDATASVTDLTGSESTYTATIKATTTGSVIIQVPAGTAQDAAGNGNAVSPEYTVTISIGWMPDKNLRDLVRDAFGLPANVIFTKEELPELTELDAAEVPFSDDSKITDLTGLEYATELTELYLNEHAISDLSPLAALTQLKVISLNDNVIRNLRRFDNLTKLTKLYLNDNLIDDLSPLESLPQLTKLSLNDNVIEDISALEALAALTGLSLNLNLIDDITALEALTQLTTLSLNENPIDDLTPLQGLTELTELSLNDNSIDDIFFCTALTQLKVLCLEDNEISDVSPLVGLPNLELLKLSGNPIHDPASLIGIARRIEADALIASLVPDEALAEILRDIFDLDRAEYVTFADMRSLTTFEAPDNDITDLSGLEHATDLNTLDLRGNTIADITPLKALTKLTTLDLGFNSITDVTPLAGLVKLETLRLTGNPIQNANSLSNLTAHIEADIVVPGVIIDPALAVAIQETLGLPANTRILAATLENLVSLNVPVGEVDTLAGLEHATHLTTLRIDAGSITDVTPLQALAALTTLEINSDALTVITPLQTLTQLTTLKMNGGAITDVTPLQTLTALTILELRDNTITDITPLALLIALTTLDLSGNNISSIEVLQVLTGLTTLNVSGNSISSIEVLQVLTGLTTLNVSGNSISSIEVLQVLTGLTTLNVSGNSISSIEVLQVLTGLTTLNVSGNSISSIEAVQVLTGLTTLEFADNSLSSIDGLQALPGLTTLNLSTNDLSDIQPLQGLTGLKQLYLASNNISDVSPLAGLLNLELLRLAGNPIMDTSPLFVLVTAHKLADVDIEISQWAPWDVNQDGVVNAMDATLVTAAIGQTAEAIANSLTDVNADGVVDRNDLLLVQEHLNTDAAGAPSTDTIVALLGLDTLKSLSRTSLEAELNYLIAETDGSLKYQRAIKFLENFLLALRPNKTRLLANYPNPFNPETWIPYTLATVSAVQITIYDARGAVVRRLDLGHQREGYYTSRSRAAYWDGRNHVGERVASGIYFYELEADDISRLRKMVILK